MSHALPDRLLGSDRATIMPAAIAELKTPDGNFQIMERRKSVRVPVSNASAAQVTNLSASPQMMALGGLIILGVLVASYTTKYDAAIGHVGGPISIPAVGFLALQVYLARAAFRLFHDLHTFDSVGSYVQNRFMRYLPAVIPAVLLGYFVTFLIGGHTDLHNLPANLLMLSDLVGVEDIDSSHWRLKVEIIQSILVGLLWFGPLRRHIATLLTIGLALSAYGLAGEPARSNVLTLHGFVTSDGYLPLFAFGIALHHVIKDGRSPLWWTLLTVSWMLASASNTLVHAPFTAMGLALLALVASGRLEALGRIRPLVALGRIAFPIYVVHFVSGFALIQYMEHAGCAAWIAVATAATIVVVIGAIFNIAFEKPAERNATAIVRLSAGLLKSPVRFLSGMLADLDGTTVEPQNRSLSGTGSLA